MLHSSTRHLIACCEYRFVAWCGLVWLVVCGGCRTAADFHNLDGVRYFQTGNAPAALQQFQQAVVANPGNADAYYNLAATLHQLGRQTNNRETLRQAEGVYNQCLDLNENHVDCRRGLAVLLVETDRPQSAFDLLKNWATQRPDIADAQIELGRLYEEFGDTKSAKQHLNQALLIDQRASRAWAALGRLSEQAGDTEQALANYHRSLQANPYQPLVGQRIAALQPTTPLNLQIAVPPSPVGPRTVTSPAPTRPRY